MSVERCPICAGTGKVPSDFYPDLAKNLHQWVNCRGCGGSGVFVIPEMSPLFPSPNPGATAKNRTTD